MVFKEKLRDGPEHSASQTTPEVPGGVMKPDTQGFLGNGPGTTLQRTLMK